VSGLNSKQILVLLEKLNKRLLANGVVGELYLVGGAVMCLVYEARASTKDLDGLFVPKEIIRKAAVEISEEEELAEDWLNDAVKGFFSERGTFNDFVSFSNLKVFVASAKYLLAMKSLAMRFGAEFSDESDVRYLLRYLNIERYEDAIKVLEEYYPLSKYPQKTLYALEEILESTKLVD